MHSDKAKFHITSRSGISDKLIYIYHLPVKPLPNPPPKKRTGTLLYSATFLVMVSTSTVPKLQLFHSELSLDFGPKIGPSNPLSVSENSGTPKSSILIGFSIINHPFWGTPIFWKHPPIEREDQFGDTEHGYLPPEPPLLLPCIDTSPKPDSRTGGSMMPRAGFLCQGTGLNQLVLCWDPCVNLTSVRNDVHLLWSEVKLQDYWWF